MPTGPVLYTAMASMLCMDNVVVATGPSGNDDPFMQFNREKTNMRHLAKLHDGSMMANTLPVYTLIQQGGISF